MTVLRLDDSEVCVFIGFQVEFSQVNLTTKVFNKTIRVVNQWVLQLNR